MNERTHLMIKVAKLYYESGLTQEAISRQLRISRPTISRLMQDAIDQGIVKITITQDSERFAEVEKLLCDIYGLLEVIVTDISDPDSNSEVCCPVGRRFGRTKFKYARNRFSTSDFSYAWSNSKANAGTGYC